MLLMIEISTADWNKQTNAVIHKDGVYSVMKLYVRNSSVERLTAVAQIFGKQNLVLKRDLVACRANDF